MSAFTVTFLSSLLTLTDSPKWPVLPPIFMRWRRYSAKLVVLKTLSSTGLLQSMVKLCETLVSTAYFLVTSFLTLASLGAVLGCAYFVAMGINL